ncbi:hypothetical protein VNO77_46239 [Canavalia gladiata]|uniref:Uncharacterized protein n=1 Tax=Canavalia gladiata TaxID=3824 RepID=A0AAN9PEE5_CANGL
MPRKEESRLSRMAFLNWRGWLTFWSISSSPTSERVSPVAISASGNRVRTRTEIRRFPAVGGFSSINWDRSLFYLFCGKPWCESSDSWEGAASIALAVKTLGLGASVSSVHPRSAGQITSRGGSSYNSSGTCRGGCSQSIPWCASIRGEKVSGLETLAFAGKFSALFLSSHQGFAPEVESKGWSSSRKEAGMGVSSFKTERQDKKEGLPGSSDRSSNSLGDVRDQGYFQSEIAIN